MTIRINAEKDTRYSDESGLPAAEAAIFFLLAGRKFSNLEEIQQLLAGVATIQDISKHDGINRFLQIKWIMGMTTYVHAEDTTRLEEDDEMEWERFLDAFDLDTKTRILSELMGYDPKLEKEILMLKRPKGQDYWSLRESSITHLEIDDN